LNLSTTSNSLFGGSSTASSTTPSLFGGFTASTTTTASPSIFGQAATGDSSAPAAVFGTPSTIFGSKPSEASTTNIFAPIPAPAIPESSKETKGVDLSASKDLATFSALSTGSEGGFSFGKKTDGFAFSGAGASLFKTAASPTKAADDSAAAGETEDAEHDPHFEPIIPLPELVIVSTGEEDEEAIFKHRAKVYRYVAAFLFIRDHLYIT
jgi:E3 SUMO-protein ligase RanBP2